MTQLNKIMVCLCLIEYEEFSDEETNSDLDRTLEMDNESDIDTNSNVEIGKEDM